MSSVLVISEIGVNHNGSEIQAYKLIDAAILAGADVCKFQLFKPELYPKDKQEMLDSLLLSRDALVRIFIYCKRHNVKFACTAFDADSLEFLLRNTDMPFIKIASPSVSNDSLMAVAAKAKKPVVISTGSSDLTQLYKVEKSLRGCDITFLYCVSKYPTSLGDVHLKRMLYLKTMQRPYGISDHSANIAVPLAAVTLGASVVECHFTMDRKQTGPDHLSSLEPTEFKSMVQGIRTIERVMK